MPVFQCIATNFVSEINVTFYPEIKSNFGMPFYCSQPIKSTDIMKRSHDVLYISACLYIAWHCVIRKNKTKKPYQPLKYAAIVCWRFLDIDEKSVMSLDIMWYVYTVNYKNICLRLVLHDCWTIFESQKMIIATSGCADYKKISSQFFNLYHKRHLVAGRRFYKI